MARSPSAVRERDRLVFWVFGATVAVRLVYFATTRSPSFRDPLIDGDYYDYLGVRLASGEGFEPGPFWQPPLYPMILGALYRVFGHDLVWPRLLQACLDGITALLAFELVKTLTQSRRFALSAGLGVALFGPLVFYAGEILPTTTAACAGMLGLFLTVRHRSRWERALASGVSIGVGALSVAPILVAIVPLAWAHWRKDRQRGALALGGCLALVACATVANFVRAHELVPISANAGINLYIGNHPDSDRLVAVRPGAEWERLSDEPVRQGISSLSGQDRYFVRRAAGLCVADVLGCLRRFAWKGEQLVSSREIPRNENLDVIERDAFVLRLLTPSLGPASLPYLVVIPLAVAGIVAAFRRGKPSSKLVAKTALFLAAVPVLFFVTGRYRAVLAPELVVLAAYGAFVLRSEWSQRRPEAIAAAIAFGLALRPIHLPVDDVPFEAEMYYAIGGRHARLGDDSGAVDAWQKAVALRPDYLEAGHNLGLAYERQGRLEQARAAYRGVLAYHPDDRETLARLQALER